MCVKYSVPGETQPHSALADSLNAPLTDLTQNIDFSLHWQWTSLVWRTGRNCSQITNVLLVYTLHDYTSAFRKAFKYINVLQWFPFRPFNADGSWRAQWSRAHCGVIVQDDARLFSSTQLVGIRHLKKPNKGLIYCQTLLIPQWW